jgi:hypothetical protein
MFDRYTKAVLTLIAVSLAAIAIEHATPEAHAQPEPGCGGLKNPCYVSASSLAPIDVRIERSIY